MKTRHRQISFGGTFLLVISLLTVFTVSVYAHPVGGVVKDCDRKTVAGAIVVLFDDKGNRVGRSNTNANGVFEIPQVNEGTYSVYVVCPGSKENENGESVKFKVPGVLSVNLALFCCPKGKIRATTTNANGLHSVTFDTLNGQVRVSLPDDIAAGDTISGTVVAEPNGKTKEERERNLGELQGLVFEIKDFSYDSMNEFSRRPRPVISRIPVATDKPFTLKVPPLTSVSSIPSPALGIILNNPSGSFTLSADIPVNSRSNTSQPLHPSRTNDFRLPTIGQQGRPIVITGPFDGDSSNTRLTVSALRTTVQDFEKTTEHVSGGFGLLAESPGKAIFSSATNVTGPIPLAVDEGGTRTVSVYRNVGVNLTASKTNLLKGEKTELRVEVSGLQGIKEPLPLTLEGRGVITMAGGMYQSLVVQPSQVSADGRYSTTRAITGLQAGEWGATATVETHSFNVRH